MDGTLRLKSSAQPEPAGTTPPWVVAAWLGLLVVAAALRSRGLLSGELLWHPDEIVFCVVRPLALLSGDLNPHFFTYPSFHLYQLGGLYGVQYLWAHATTGVDLQTWVAQRMVWSPESARDAARWLGVAYSVGTVALAGWLAGALAGCRGWRAAMSSTAGLAGGWLTAANVVLVRQAAIAGTDTPLGFWFTATVLAALGVLRAPALGRYLAAGLLIGAAGATKYPGASVAVAVLAAHLLARRRLLDRRLWIAAAASLATYVVLAPYTLLDFGSFRTYFLEQLQHAADDPIWDVPVGPLFHLTSTLRLGAGLPAWLAWIAACAWAVWRRPTPHLVVLAAFAAGYAAVSWGNLSFTRYALPLVPLQLALVGDGIDRGAAWLRSVAARPIPRHIPVTGLAALLLGLAPAYGAWQVSRLQSSPDARTLARDWIETHIPAGATLCNFGGWAGDPQVNTFEQIWWRYTKYADAFGEEDLEPVRRAYTDTGPYFSYAVQTVNEGDASGRLGLIRERDCAYVVVHQHPLYFSRVDSSLTAELTSVARLAAAFDPGPPTGAVFDGMDAYYLPLAGWRQTASGPSITIWEVLQDVEPPRRQTPVGVLARALSLRAAARADAGDLSEARRDVARSLSLDPGQPEAQLVLADVVRQEGNLSASVAAYRGVLLEDPDNVRALLGLAQVSVLAGRHHEAVALYDQALQQLPGDARVLNNLAVSWRAVGRADTARVLWGMALAHQEDYADAHFNLGTALYLDGDPIRALPHLDRAVELAPDSTRYCSNAAAAWRAAGRPDRAAELWTRVVTLDPDYLDARYNLAYTLQHDLHDPAAAWPHWEVALRLAPDDVDVLLNGAQALLDTGRPAAAVDRLRSFLAEQPDHPRRRDVEAALAAVRGTSG